MFVMARFGLWDAMLTEPKPALESQFMTGIWHYGRALAYIHTNRLGEAQRELGLLSALREAMGKVERYVSATTRMVFPGAPLSRSHAPRCRTPE